MSEFHHRTTELPLTPLTDLAARTLADLLLPERAIDDATRDGILLRAEGNPLYLRELLTSVVEESGQDRSRSWSVSIRHLLPSSLESLFVARIDRLPPEARRLVQVAAVIGREFPVKILQRAAPSEGFDDELATLLRADLIREVRRYPQLECTFRHGLIQEAALSTLTPGRLREIHGRVGAAFEEFFAGSPHDHLELLAYHYYRSDDQSRAMAYLEQAAERAAGLGAAPQAGELLRRAKKVADRLGDVQSARRIGERQARLEVAP
ncbi:MAG: hypothetical protein E6G44_08445 [Actinobacteria bacterium]|nr:MAG: hypothetical protein E6G44_08445 [Actinomycetota bacterium]